MEIKYDYVQLMSASELLAGSVGWGSIYTCLEYLSGQFESGLSAPNRKLCLQVNKFTQLVQQLKQISWHLQREENLFWDFVLRSFRPFLHNNLI